MGLLDTFRVCGVRVTLHTPVVYPGSIVTGVMSFNATSTVSMRALRIQLTGGEHTTISDPIIINPDYCTDWSTDPRLSSSDNVFLNQLFTVSGKCLGRPPGQDGELPAGEYAIPFEFLIPHGMPPTGTAGLSLTHRAFIDYMITGTIGISDNCTVLDTAVLQVATTMPRHQYDERGAGGVVRETVPLRCCCCSKGAMTYTVRANKNMVALDRDDPITVTVTADASSTEEMAETLVVSLQNHTTYAAGSRSWCLKSTMVAVKQSVKIPAGSASRELIVSLPTVAEDDEWQLFPSLRGAFFHSQWFVVVDVEMSLANDLSASIPIAVAPRVDETNQAPILELDRLTYPATSVPVQEFVYSVPPQLRDMARGLSQLPPVTGQAPPAPYTLTPEPPPPCVVEASSTTV